CNTQNPRGYHSLLARELVMSDTAIDRNDPRFAAASGQPDLRGRIGWICHALRIAAVLWIVWNLAFVIYYWSDKTQVLENYGRLFSADLGDVSAARYAAAFAAVMISLVFAAVVSFAFGGSPAPISPDAFSPSTPPFGCAVPVSPEYLQSSS